ncbi:MAG: bifunctional demethylmenaquinone methyltransferase/2-methoxy-6-polyprenyl-1,4-benzoquinol methylase UbiE [Bacteroidia bacterium]
MEVKPDIQSAESKKTQVEHMFDSISPKYDFLNHTLSLGIDKIWRRKTIDKLKAINPKKILDVATGTGDLAIEALRLNPDQIIGIDISEGMMAVGREKIKKAGISKIWLEKGDSENLKYSDNEFDAVTVAFGVRNFENLEKGLKEMNRVLRVGGITAILEFSKPVSFPFKQGYNFYFSNVLPFVGKLFSKNSKAYTYLPKSVSAFPDGNDFIKIMTRCGYLDCKEKRFMFGICTLYTASK